MLGRVSYIRKDKQLSEKVFQEGKRILEEHTDHAGYSCAIRYFFSFRGMTLRVNQEIEKTVEDWAATVTSSRVASDAAGRIHFLRAKGWDDYFDGKTDENSSVQYGYSLTVSAPGVSMTSAEMLHKLFCDLFDDDLYIGFDMQLPQGIKGYPSTREFSC